MDFISTINGLSFWLNSTALRDQSRLNFEKIKNSLVFSLPFIASAVMLSLIQAPLNCSYLAWIALVPFVLACTARQRPKKIAVVTFIVALAYWLVNLYWIRPITIPGWIATCIYLAVLWPIVALCIRSARIKKIPLILSVPVLFVAAEHLQGFLLGGFFWRFLAHSQYQNIKLIQIADIFGTGGLSFLIAAVNGLAAEWIIVLQQQKSGIFPQLKTLAHPRLILKSIVIAAAVISTLLYGGWRIKQTDKFTEKGPVIAVLQSNVPQSVKRSFQSSDKIFEDLLKNSQKASQAHPELIIWPETMVQAVLDEQIWPILQSAELNKNLHQKLLKHAENNAYLLVGAYGMRLRQNSSGKTYLAKYNSAYLYTPKGSQFPERYDKMHLVPFGEYIPFKRKIPSFYNLLMQFTPYNYDYSLDAGEKYTVFPIKSSKTPGKTYNFGVIICYEDTIPEIARQFTLDKNNRKRLDWLVNISNDGWFVKFRDNKVYPSTELAQHAAICVFRAVENRIPVVRSTNTGISCIIDSLGRLKNSFITGQKLPSKAMKRQGMEGWFADNLNIDKRTTFFSRYGQWLSLACVTALVALIIAALTPRFIRAKKPLISRRSNNGK